MLRAGKPRFSAWSASAFKIYSALCDWVARDDPAAKAVRPFLRGQPCGARDTLARNGSAAHYSMASETLNTGRYLECYGGWQLADGDRRSTRLRVVRPR